MNYLKNNKMIMGLATTLIGWIAYQLVLVSINAHDNELQWEVLRSLNALHLK